jgi:8-oxo-dGTP diphosphatase
MNNSSLEPERPAIAAAIITLNGRVLMVKRRVAEGSLSWQFPAGEVETGESSIDAAAREALEETGVQATQGELLGERTHPKTGRKMVYVAFEHAEGEAFVADSEELDHVEWAPLSALREYVPYGLFEPVQEYLDRKLG